MLIKKENTSYGYKATIRYDTKSPSIYVLEKGTQLKLSGEADLTVVTGKINIARQEKDKKVYDRLETKDTYRIPKDRDIVIKVSEKTVLIEDNSTAHTIAQYLDLTVTEDEPSSDDLKYINDE